MQFFRFTFPLFIALYIPFSLLSWNISDLSLEEKVGQLLMVHFNGKEANEEAAEFIQEIHVGGIIYYQWANGLESPDQVLNLSLGLQQIAKKTPHSIPLFIAVDQEGGRVNRLKHGFTIFPGNFALGKTGNLNWGEDSARMIGEELNAVGISMNLAPVVDVFTEPANPIIGIRAFSSNPQEVAQWGEYVLRGYRTSGVIPVLKHFPGHGDVLVDSHEALPVVKKPRDILDRLELYPFCKLAPHADAIMTAHLKVPALDSDQIATYSKKIIDELLRQQYQFSGVIMTDSLAMGGALNQYPSIEEAVLKSLEAGHDLILLGGKQLLDSQKEFEFNLEDVKRVHRFLVESVRGGKLSEERINASVARILALKEKYQSSGLTNLNQAMLDGKLRTPPHCLLSKQIAEKALQIDKGEELFPLSWKDGPVCVIAPVFLREELAQTDWQNIGTNGKIIYFEGFNPNGSAIEEVLSLMGKKEHTTFFFACNAWQFPGQQELFRRVDSQSFCTVAIVVRDPLDAEYLKTADGVVSTFSPVAVSLQAAYDAISATK